MHGEFYLVTYTILSQAAIGLAIMLFIASRVLGEEKNKSNYKMGYLISTVLILLAMAVSGMHLGSPMRGMNAIINIGSSWLSREIFLTGLFFASSVIAYYMIHKNKNFHFAALASSVIGFFCVIGQAAVYANTIIPAWGSGHGYVTFIGATMAMGAFLGVLVLFKGGDGFNQAGAKKYITIAMVMAFVGVLMQAGFYSIFAGHLAQTGKAGIGSLGLLSEKGTMMAIRWICSAIALVGLGVIVHKKEGNSMLFMFTLLIFLGEILNRTMFYGIGIAIGL